MIAEGENNTGLQDTPRRVLKEHFGFDAFMDGQEAVINTLLEGRSALAIFPTGGGKSICYQLPSFLLDGLTLVISPLIALMKDQVDALVAKGIPAARLDSTLDKEEVLSIYKRLDSGDLKILYIAPERLVNGRFLLRLKRTDIALLAVDEAHCISEWGHNFRPDYLKIAHFARQLSVKRVLALTATATPEVAVDIQKAFDISKADSVLTGFYRDNLSLTVSACPAGERDTRLLGLVRKNPDAPTIVYVTLQKTAETVAQFLLDNEISADAYHAGLKDERRANVQESFMSGKLTVVVATIAFGMGIDKSNIRAIYHYNLPKSLENYMQEIGRAGRDGGDAHCELLACGDDITVLENFIYGDTPEPIAVSNMIREILGNGEETFSVSVYELSRRFDIRTLVVSTVLAYLELEGIIASTGPFYAELKLYAPEGESVVLSKFNDERSLFLSRIFRAGKLGTKWITIDPIAAAGELGEPVERIRTAITYLEDKGWLDVQVSGLRQGYRVLKRPDDLESIIDKLNSDIQRREGQQIGRMKTVIDFAEGGGSRWKCLLNYFGEKRALEESESECGAGKLPLAEGRSVNQSEMKCIRGLQKESHDALASERQMARFLAGINSPATIKSRLHRDKRFGLLQSIPFIDILQALKKKAT